MMGALGRIAAGKPYESTMYNNLGCKALHACCQHRDGGNGFLTQQYQLSVLLSIKAHLGDVITNDRMGMQRPNVTVCR